MSTPAQLHAAVVAALQAIPTVIVHDKGMVPANPAAQADGRVLPYAVPWPSPAGDGFDEAEGDATTGLDWTVQVTVASGDQTWTLQAIDKVRQTLARRFLADDVSRLREITPAGQVVLRDDTVTPPRWYAPLQFRCQTA